MKRILIFCCAVIMLASCQNDKKDTTSSEDAGDKIEKTSDNGPVDVNTLPGQMKYIAKGIWWYDAYISSRPEYRKEQRGKWFEILPNQTFKFGKFQEQEGVGKWHYIEGENKIFLTMPGDNYTFEWTIQMSKTNDLMIWTGPRTGTNKGDIARLVNYLQRPTEKDVAQ